MGRRAQGQLDLGVDVVPVELQGGGGAVVQGGEPEVGQYVGAGLGGDQLAGGHVGAVAEGIVELALRGGSGAAGGFQRAGPARPGRAPAPAGYIRTVPMVPTGSGGRPIRNLILNLWRRIAFTGSR